MKKIIFLISIFINGVITQIYSLDTVASKYYPMSVGNIWTYSHFATNGPSYRYQEKITGSIVTNGHIYFIFTYFRIGYPQTISYRRIDSVKNNVLTFSSSSGCSWLQNEITGDSLSARKGDSSLYGCTSYYRADTATKSLFGIPRKTKIFLWSDYFESGLTRELTRDFGFTYEHSFGHTNQSYNSLIGCLINGVIYGDTSLVNIVNVSTEIPEKFELSQNYPNPFNPMTKLKFQMPNSGFAILKIYNALGSEIQTLVNQSLSPGTYEVNWDASAYPSGVYYYMIKAGDPSTGSGQVFKETKKMVLIK